MQLPDGSFQVFFQRSREMRRPPLAIGYHDWLIGESRTITSVSTPSTRRRCLFSGNWLLRLCDNDSRLGRCPIAESSPQPSGKPIIDAEPSRPGADQPHKEEHVQDFREIEEIVEPVERRKSFWHSGKLRG